MAKKKKQLDPWIYNARLIRGVDGDTADAWIDCGFNIQIKKRRKVYNEYEGNKF